MPRMSPIPPLAVTTLLEAGRRHEAEDALLLALLQRIARLSMINRMTPTEWNPIMQSLSTSDLVSLFRGVVLAEQLLNWSGGSVAAGIWVHRELMQRDEALAVTVGAWAVQRTNNDYIRRLPTRIVTAEDRREAEERWRNRDRSAEIAEYEAVRRAGRHQGQRARAAQLRNTAIRTEFLDALSRLSIEDQLRQLSQDQRFPALWYPTSLAHRATLQLLRDLVPDTLKSLIEKLDCRQRGPWATFKKRLATVERESSV